MAEYSLTAPLSAADVAMLRSGDVVKLSGTVYTARDAAHKKLAELIEAGKPLPFPVDGAVIYYVGPSPTPTGRPIGSAGPTTSYRMDAYTPALLAQGVRGCIGKGRRSPTVRQAFQDYGAVYFGATGGAGALLSLCIQEAEVIGFEELGPEAIRRLQVKDLPVLVINDVYGGELYAEPDLKAVGLA